MKFFLTTLTIFLALQVNAQLEEIVAEDFSTNIRQWDVDEYKHIIDGSLNIKSTEDGDQSIINVFIDPNRDFTLSASFVQKNNEEADGFALVWGINEDNYNVFAVSEKDYAIHSGDPSNLKGWKNSENIKSIGTPNLLKIELKSGILSFYINDKKVDERKNFPLFGNQMGVLAIGRIKFSVDNFQFNQNQNIDLPITKHDTYNRENLGTSINTDKDELGPMISLDGKILFFAKQNVPENIGGIDDDEDVWISRYENEIWTTAKNMGKAVNTTMSDNLVAVSADNNTMMFVEANELALRHRTETGWSALEKLNLSFKNESAYFVASLSSDGKAIVFSAKFKDNLFYNPKRDEGDLYVCIKDKNNRWSAPVNLGRMINTAGIETSPFLSADGNTLYFSTDGRPGYGYQDVFYATKNGSGWTNWSQPINMGPSVNTAGFDAYYTLPASGDYAYYVSPNEKGNADIFRIKLHEASKPKPVTLVRGVIIEKNSRKPLAAKIHFENLETGSEVGEARSDPKTGAYQIILPFGSNYGVRASVFGYYSLHENLDLKINGDYNEVHKDLLMVPFEIGATVKLNNVFFEPGLPVLKKESFHELDRLVTVLHENMGMDIDLAGHTDNKGDAVTLMKLSQDRVEAVKAYLTTHGISSSRITGSGYGSTMPVAPSDTEENSQLNRRVEFKITKI